MPTAWDALLAKRTVGLHLAFVALAAVVAAMTDEATSSWSSRIARLSVLSAALGAVAAALIVTHADRRGELRTLAASGASHARATRGAILGAVPLTLVLAAPLLLHVVSLAALFPVLPSSSFRAVGSRIVAPTAGISLDRGVATFASPIADVSFANPPRGVVFVVVALSAALIPAWAIAPAPLLRRASVGSLAALAAVVAFHLVAAGRPALVLFVPLACLGLDLALLRANPDVLAPAAR